MVVYIFHYHRLHSGEGAERIVTCLVFSFSLLISCVLPVECFTQNINQVKKIRISVERAVER